MSRASVEPEIRFRPRQSVEFSFLIPEDVLESLRQVAEERQTSVEGLIRMYVGAGLRTDIGRLYGDRVLHSVGKVLAKHIDSPEEVEAIVQELREAAGGPPASWIRDPQ